MPVLTSIESTDAADFESVTVGNLEAAVIRKRLLAAQLAREPITILERALDDDGYSDIELADGTKVEGVPDVYIQTESRQTVYDLCITFNVATVHRDTYAGLAIRVPNGGEFIITNQRAESPSMHATSAIVEFRNTAGMLKSRELLSVKSIMRMIVEKITR